MFHQSLIRSGNCENWSDFVAFDLKLLDLSLVYATNLPNIFSTFFTALWTWKMLAAETYLVLHLLQFM